LKSPSRKGVLVRARPSALTRLRLLAREHIMYIVMYMSEVRYGQAAIHRGCAS
jgi:hypothetical protein